MPLENTPKTTIMEITTSIGCKVACSYCPQNRLLESYKKRSNIYIMGFGTFKTCIDKIPQEVGVHFTGMAEPWLNPECTKMLLYACKTGHQIGVSTTLMGMSLSDVNLLEPIDFKFFWIHLPSAGNCEKIKVDEDYLKLLDRITKSNLNATYHVRGKTKHPKLKMMPKIQIDYLKVRTRAGNIRIRNRPLPLRKKGVINCAKNLHSNILLPNGDVILCCMDYEMKHILGNLILTDYDSLFHTEKFLEIKNGLSDESLDILCRHCDMFVLNNSALAIIYNSFWCNLISIRRFSYLYELMERLFIKIKDLLSIRNEKPHS